MRRLLTLVAALVLGLGVVVPAALAASPLATTGRVLVSTEGNVTIPAGEQADVVVVVEGTADIRGQVNTLVVVDGSINLVGARLETIVAIRSPIEAGPGTIVYGEVQQVESPVHQVGDADLQGGIVDLSSRWLEVGAAFAGALILLWIGFALSTFVAGLLLAALAGRQLGSAVSLIRREPVLTGVAGLLGVILIPVAAIALFPTVIGAPLGFGILLVAFPIVAFGGYLVAATWVGELILRTFGTTREPERPYLAIVTGIVVLGVIGLVPVLNLLVALASLFGFGAVLVLAIRTIATGSRPATGTAQPLPMPTGA